MVLPIVAAVFILGAAQPDTTALMAPVNVWVRAFDTHQAQFPSDAFTDDCTVIDEFSPFAWDPKHATIRQWYAAVEGLDSPKDRASVLQSRETVVVGSPENVAVRGDIAYMTFHSVWTGFRGSKRFAQQGLFTVVERKTPAGWRISANSWGILSNQITAAR